MTETELKLDGLDAAPAAVKPVKKSYHIKSYGGEFKLMRMNDAEIGSAILDNPPEAINYLLARLSTSLIYHSEVENMIVIHLNTRKRAIGFEIISKGTLDTLLVHPREVFRSAIVMNDAAILLAHNHPSGDPMPSEADIKVTRDMIRAGQLLKIEVIDHLILGKATADNKGYSSLRELGYFYN